MRLLLLAATASLVGSSAFGQSLLGQSDPGGARTVPTVHVAAPPAVVAAPPVPVAPAPARVLAPPGLVETPLPPPDMVQQTALPPDNAGSSRSLQPQAMPPLSSAVPSTPTQPAAQTLSAQTLPAQTLPAQTLSAQAVSPAEPSANMLASGNVGQSAQSVSGAQMSDSPPPGAVASGALPANDVAPTPDNKWVYGHTVELGVLNKVEGSTKVLTIPVGGQAVAGDLTVSVQACVVRPADALPDTAVFLTLQPDNESTPVYRGWIVKSMPGSTTAENADEIFRIVACQ